MVFRSRDFVLWFVSSVGDGTPGPHILDNHSVKKLKRENFGKLRESFMIESQWLYGVRESVLLSGCHEAKVNHPQNLGYAVWKQPPKL